MHYFGDGLGAVSYLEDDRLGRSSPHHRHCNPISLYAILETFSPQHPVDEGDSTGRRDPDPMRTKRPVDLLGAPQIRQSATMLRESVR